MRNESAKITRVSKVVFEKKGVLPDMVPPEGVEILSPMGSDDLSEVSHEGEIGVLPDMVPLEGDLRVLSLENVEGDLLMIPSEGEKKVLLKTMPYEGEGVLLGQVPYEGEHEEGLSKVVSLQSKTLKVSSSLILPEGVIGKGMKIKRGGTVKAMARRKKNKEIIK